MSKKILPIQIDSGKNYSDCISYLFSLERAGIKYDLKNIRSLLKFLNNPQENFKSIHIAGTNGKGSVSSILNSMFIEKGFNTGLYTSPHIKDFRERILVNGKFISKKFIIDFVSRVNELVKRIKPSFFEVTTAMAFDYFRYKKIEYAVIESGLGGRLDSTNVLNPLLSIITSIDIDHTEFLGNKIESITKEKGGIIKKDIPVIVGNVSGISKEILESISSKLNSEIIFQGKVFDAEVLKRNETGFYFNVKTKSASKDFFFPVVGDYQINNIKTSLEALNTFGKREDHYFDVKLLDSGFKNIRSNSKFYGRFDLISEKPKVVIDISHNLQGIKNIKSNLQYFKFRKLFIVFSMMGDKDYKSCLEELTKLGAGKIILTKAQYKRAAEPDALLKTVKNKKTFVIKKDLNNAVVFAKSLAGPDDLILLTGSFFLISEFLALFNKLNK